MWLLTLSPVLAVQDRPLVPKVSHYPILTVPSSRRYNSLTLSVCPLSPRAGMSREGSLASASRPASVMSTDSAGGVKLRHGAASSRKLPGSSSREVRARPVSIATSGVMSTSMFEQRAPPAAAQHHSRTRTSHKRTPRRVLAPVRMWSLWPKETMSSSFNIVCSGKTVLMWPWFTLISYTRRKI